MNAISIQQPWAELIVSGVKDVENRSWYTSFRGRILIHAGKKFDNESFIELQECGFFKGKKKSDFQLGGIVGITTITNCVTKSKSQWFFGEYGFVLKDSERVPFHPHKGQLGIFNTPIQYR